MSSEAVTVFISYSHKDKDLRNELENHLSSMRRQNIISDWHDGKIIPGENWRTAIFDQLNQAELILLLISSDFLGSDFCYDKELTRAIDRHNKGEAVVMPIILRDVYWKGDAV